LGLFALILIFDSLRQLGFSLIKAMERMEIQAALHMLTNAIIVASGFALLILSPSISSLTYAYVVGAGVGTIATIYITRAHIKNILRRFDWRIAKEILSSAWPLAISSLLGSIMISTDIFIIGLIQSPEDVGFYSVADRIMQLLYAPALILATSTFPLFSRLAHINNEGVRAILKRLLYIVRIILIPVTILGILLTPAIIHLFFGQEYSPAIIPLQILLLTLIPRFTSILLSNVLFAYDKQKTLVTFTMLGIGLNIIFDLLLIPTYGIIGSAIATLLAQLISTFYLWQVAKTSMQTQSA
jgi:PST family polysaccharide transporter